MKIDERIFGDGKMRIMRESIVIITLEIYETKSTYTLYVEIPVKRLFKVEKKYNEEIWVVYNKRGESDSLTDREKELIKIAIDWKIEDKYEVIM